MNHPVGNARLVLMLALAPLLWACPPGTTCQEGFEARNGTCLKRCNSPSECSAFETCLDGLCQTTATGGSSGQAGSSSTTTTTAGSSTSLPPSSSRVVGSSSGTFMQSTSTPVSSGVSASGSSQGSTSVAVGSSALPPVSSSTSVPSSSTVSGLSSSLGPSSVGSSSSAGPSAPVLTSVGPASVLAGCGGTLMQVTGTGFSNGDQALFDGADVTTTFVSSTRLDVSVLGAFLENVGSHTLEVLGQGGVSSNQLSVEVRPSPARHQSWLGGGYTGGGWTSQVVLFNPGNQTASVTVTFFSASQLGVQMVSVPPIRVVEVLAPPGADEFSARVDSPEVAVAAAVLTRDPGGSNKPSYLSGPQDAPAVLAATPLVQGGDLTRIRVTNPGVVTANATVTWRSSAGASRTEDVTVAPGQEQRADTPLPDTHQWAQLTSNTPVLSYFSSGPSTLRAWMGANLQAEATQQVFLAYRENNQELRFRVANPNQATTLVTANRAGAPGDIFNTMLGQRDVYNRTESGNPFTPSGTLLFLQVNSTLPTVAALALQPSGGPDGDTCALVPLRAANDLILLGGKNRDGWETRYLLFNAGAAQATYTVLIVGVANSLPFPGGTLDPGQGRVIHTAEGSFPRPSDAELALMVTSNQPLMGQVLRYDTNASLACLAALTPP